MAAMNSALVAFAHPTTLNLKRFSRSRAATSVSFLVSDIYVETVSRRAKGKTVAKIQASEHQDVPRAEMPKGVMRISRRQAVQLLNGLLGAMTLGLLVKMKEQFRLISPRAILASLGLGSLPARVAPAIAATSADSKRLQEAVKYVEMIDKRPTIQCPDFTKGLDWINSRPLSLQKELTGKVVLLDFFTYCCINCQHVLPKLRELEEKYGQDGSGGVAVVGVHSAKFTAEKETKNIAAAVERYDVLHPVVNDEKMDLWSALGVSSWPTLALLGPRGNLLAIWSGERQEEDIDLIIAAALEFYSDVIDHRPLPAAPQRNSSLRRPSDSPLRYPGKIAISEDGGSLFVADSGNNRILQLDAQSLGVLRMFGSGEQGMVDSSDPSKAAFHSPQGIVEYDGVLYVADTESHAVRAIDVLTGKVETIGGTGEQGFDYTGGKVGTSQPLSSPWDVEVAEGTLYVAMAGTHQLWSLPLPQRGQKHSYAKPWQVFSGSGRELEKNSVDGRLAAWAQPSHLSVAADGMLFVADSESSSVRAVDTNIGRHPTRTLAGGDGLLAENLFAFGDREGRGAKARFQHPLAVCFDDQKQILYVADSYNHRIKVVDETGAAKVYCGNGSPGLRDGSAQDAMFWEPSGLALSPDGKTLFVADTNNFAIRIIDTKTRAVSTLNLASTVPDSTSRGSDKALILNRRRAVQIPCGPVDPTSVLRFTITLPESSHFTPGATSRFQVNLKNTPSTSGDQNVSDVVCLLKGSMSADGRTGSFVADLSACAQQIGSAEAVEVEAVTYYCTELDDVCRTESDIFDVKLASDAVTSDEISHIILPRKVMRSKD